MKVKNIMFAGFAAAILSGVCGAASAADYTLVTQGYVTDKLDEKADKSYVGTIPDGVNVDNVVAYVEEKTKGIASEGAMETLSGRVTAAEGDIDDLESLVGEKSVATQIAEAVDAEVVRADAAYQPKGNYQPTGDYALKSELPTVPTDVSAFNNDAGYLTTTAANELYDAIGAADAVEAKLSNYATTADLEAVEAKAEADVAMEKVTGLADALNAKAAASDVATLTQDVADLETSKADADAVYTKTETDGLLNAKQDTLTFDTTPTAGSTNPVTSGGVQAALATKAEASAIPTDYVNTQTFTEYKNTVTNELAGKQATIENLAAIEAGATAGSTAVQPGDNVSELTNDVKYQTETEVANTIAAGNYLTSTGLAQGTYLVTSDGKNGITYKSVVVIDANGNEI